VALGTEASQLADADAYELYAVIKIGAQGDANDWAGFLVDQKAASATSHSITHRGDGTWRLNKNVTGTVTNMQSWAAAYAADTILTARLQVRSVAGLRQFNLYVTVAGGSESAIFTGIAGASAVEVPISRTFGIHAKSANAPDATCYELDSYTAYHLATE
jgi:hypothetical protein